MGINIEIGIPFTFALSLSLPTKQLWTFLNYEEIVNNFWEIKSIVTSLRQTINLNIIMYYRNTCYHCVFDMKMAKQTNTSINNGNQETL